MSYDNTDAVRLRALMAEAATAKNNFAVRTGEIIELLSPDPTALTLPATGWTNGSGVTDYPYYYDLAATGAAATDAAEACIDAGSQASAAACGLCPACETWANAIRFFAAALPTAAMTGSYILSKTNAGA